MNVVDNFLDKSELENLHITIGVMKTQYLVEVSRSESIPCPPYKDIILHVL